MKLEADSHGRRSRRRNHGQRHRPRLRPLRLRRDLARCGRKFSYTRPRHHREKSGPRSKKRKNRRGRQIENSCAHSHHYRFIGNCSRRFRRRSRARAPRSEALRAARRGQVVAPRRHPRLKHILDFSHDALAAATSRPERFIGMHFMNPVPVMALIEVIRALQTSDETFHATMALCERLEKKAGRGQRRARLRFQPRASANDQRSRIQRDGRRRDGRSGRLDHEAGNESSRWARSNSRISSASTSACTFSTCSTKVSTTRNIALAPAKENGGRRLARSKVRPRILRLREVNEKL